MYGKNVCESNKNTKIGEGIDMSQTVQKQTGQELLSVRGITKRFGLNVVLKGIEYDTNNAGHFLVILPEGVKPRILEMRGMPVELLTRVVHAYGGILGPAHPFGEKYLSFGSSKKYQRNPKIMQEFDFLEAYNSCEVEERNQEAKKAARKYFLAEFGGSDSHKADCIGTAIQNFVNRSIQNPI